MIINISLLKPVNNNPAFGGAQTTAAQSVAMEIMFYE